MFITWLSALFLLSGCGAWKHLPVASETRDSVRVETVVRTEYERDTLYIDIPTERERVAVRDTLSHLETSLAVSNARIGDGGTLYHSLENKQGKLRYDTEKEIVYRDSIIYREHWEVETVEVPRELTKWQKMQIKGFWLAIALLIVIVFRKGILRLLKRII